MKTLIAIAALALAGCLPHIPMHTTEHLEIGWRANYARAAAEAAATARPLLVVMASGDKDGATCPGADFLRSDALRDRRVIDLVNLAFVPVWINVRTTALPRFPFQERILVTAKVDADNRVIDRFSRTFFVHTILVSPDGTTLLNPGAATVAQTAKQLVFDGSFSYEAIDAGEYLGMMQHALERLNDLRGRRISRR
jgi:hypothetical protein